MDNYIEQLKYTFSIQQPDLVSAIQQEGKLMKFQTGEMVIQYGQYVKIVPLVIDGLIKILKEDDQGNEVFLYYLNPGDTCAMSLTCCSTYQPSAIKAIAEEPTTLIGIPVRLHESWMNNYREWKELVGRTYNNRFNELLSTIDSIAFKKMDERLLSYLQTKFSQLKTDNLQATHQEIANELGTSREVISRLLKQLENAGKIKLGRNKISWNKNSSSHFSSSKLI